MQHVGARIGSEQVLDPAFGGEGIQAARAQGDETRLGVRVGRIVLQQAQVDGFRRLVSPGANIGRRQAEQRIAVARVVP